MKRSLFALLALTACGRLTSNGFEDALDPVIRTTQPRDAGTDAGTVAQDAGVITPTTCAPSAAEIFDPAFPPAPMPARFAQDYRSANLSAQRLARAQNKATVCPDELWAWVTNSGLPDQELVVLSLISNGQRTATYTLPAQGVVRHLAVIENVGVGWSVAWVTEMNGLLTANLTSTGASSPQVAPTAVMDPADPHPFALVFAWGHPWVIVQRRSSSDPTHAELVINTVLYARGDPYVEAHHDLGPLSSEWGPLPAPAAAIIGGSTFSNTLFVRTAFGVIEFESPLVQLRSQGLSAAWHASTIVELPLSTPNEGAAIVVAAGQGIGTRRYQYEASCFAPNGGRCPFWAQIPGSTWGGFGVWNHAGIAATACGRKLAVALRSFDSIGQCESYGYCPGGDLHLTLIEDNVFPSFDRNLTPREAPADAGWFVGYEDQDVSSPIVFARSEPNRAWPYADVAWIQATPNGGIEFRLERNAADCSP
ncbi:MAG: hypothetical protein JNM17_16020 [Archangium sp.]|nr:hypothetical protein [Archangium sp.]